MPLFIIPDMSVMVRLSVGAILGECGVEVLENKDMRGSRVGSSGRLSSSRLSLVGLEGSCEGSSSIGTKEKC